MFSLGRPPLGLGGSGGICRSIRFHSSSVSSGLAMIMSSITSCYRCVQILYRLNYLEVIPKPLKNVVFSTYNAKNKGLGIGSTQFLGFVRVPKQSVKAISGHTDDSDTVVSEYFTDYASSQEGLCLFHTIVLIAPVTLEVCVCLIV